MKRESVIKTVTASLGFFVLYAVVTNLVGICIQFFYYLTYSELRLADFDTYAQQVQTHMQANIAYRGLFQFVLFLAILFLIFKVRKTNLLERIKWNPVSKQTYALVAALAVFNIIALNFLTAALLPQGWFQGASEYTTTVTNEGLLMNIVLVLLLGPFSEELLMRGLMTSRLLGRLPLWVVITIPTIIFGLGHSAGGMGQIIGATLTGLVFTLVFIWTNSLRTAVLAHVFNNLFAAFLPWSTITSGMSTSILLIVGITIYAIAIFFAYMIYIRRDTKLLTAK